jgi:transposase-like protein
MKQVYRISPVAAKPSREEFLAAFEALCRQRMSEVLQAALDAERDELIGRLRHERRSDGAPAVYRDGYERERTVTGPCGGLTIRRPRVRGDGQRFDSQLLPRHVRRLASVNKTMHELWVQGLSHRDFEPSLRGLLGADAPLSAATVARVNAQFRDQFAAWNTRRLDDRRFVYVWADGVYLGAGPEDERRVFLVVIGVDADGIKHLVALSEAMAESEASWAEVFADLRARGFKDPLLIVADGADGLWAAAGKAFPHAAQQRCWLHKMRNVLDKIPEKHKLTVRDALREAMYAPSARATHQLLDNLARSLQRDYPKAAACVRDDVDRMVAYQRFPRAHWAHLRTTNVIESPFSVVKTRTDACKRLRTGASAAYLVYALLTRLATSWRKIRGYQELRPLITVRDANALDKSQAA